MKHLVIGSIVCFTFLVHSHSYAGPGRVLKGIVKAPVKAVEYAGKGIGEGVEHTGKAVGEGVEHIVKVPYYVGEGVVKGVKAPFDNNND